MTRIEADFELWMQCLPEWSNIAVQPASRRTFCLKQVKFRPPDRLFSFYPTSGQWQGPDEVPEPFIHNFCGTTGICMVEYLKIHSVGAELFRH